ncbi:MAG TPA: choice-of-anchor D domain-containing protein [Kofleriaceae bacterium]|jgi:hypothetical protein
MLPDAPHADAPPPVDARPDAPEANITAEDSTGAPVTMLTFTNVAANATVVQSFYVHNDGGASTAALSVAASGDGFGIDAATTTCNGAIVGVDGKCRVGVKFTPTVAGSSTGTATVTAGDLSLTVDLAATSITSIEGIDSDGNPASLAFAAIAVGDTETLSFQVKNIGTVTTQPLLVTPPALPFAVDALATQCSGATLSPGESCTITIEFAPTAAGDASSVVSIASGEDIAMVPLAGTGLAPPMLSWEGAPYDFGLNGPDDANAITLFVDNSGGSAADITYDLADPTGAFSIASTTCGATLDAGTSCSFDVTYAPTALGEQTASIEVVSGGTSVPAMLLGGGAMEFDLSFSGVGTGTVTSDPAGIACMTDCIGLVTTAITLTATPDPGSTFAGWSDPTCGLSPTCSYDVSLTTVTLTADFEPSGGE